MVEVLLVPLVEEDGWEEYLMVGVLMLHQWEEDEEGKRLHWVCRRGASCTVCREDVV